jgi:hypothetical protein
MASGRGGGGRGGAGGGRRRTTPGKIQTEKFKCNTLGYLCDHVENVTQVNCCQV